MTIRGMAIQSGMSSLQLLLTGSNAGSKAAYNTAYAEAAARSQLTERMGAAQANIAAIKQDKILSDATIQLNQNQAEAQVRVAAAVAGVEGSSVDAVIGETKRMESVAEQAVKANSKQQIENQLNQVGSNMSALLAVPDTKQSLTGDLLTVAGQALGSASDREIRQITKGIGNAYDSVTQLFGN